MTASIAPARQARSTAERLAGHLGPVDVVRALTVAGVISVHVVAFTTDPASPMSGAVLALLHVNREVFLLLSAFVLTYAYHGRPRWKLTSFWRRRYWLIVVPYVTWSAIYCVTDGGPLTPVSSLAHRFVVDLLTGTAYYHLYFLLLSMQLYAMFPLLLRLVRSTRRRHHLELLVGSFAAQVALTTVFHYGLAPTGLLGWWGRHADALLISYQFYVVAGAVAAAHLEGLGRWAACHRRQLLALVGGGALVGLGSYAMDLGLGGMSPARAAEVFQPAIVLEATVVGLGLYGLGQWVCERRSRRVDQVLRTTADASFGVYLAHPLVLQGALTLASATGLLAITTRLGTAVTLIVDLGVVLPLLYALTTAGVAVARKTTASLPLTGRQVASPPPVWAYPSPRRHLRLPHRASPPVAA
jgi:peptidoglycan/LPS O-acetylase OafA/YrhL